MKQASAVQLNSTCRSYRPAGASRYASSGALPNRLSPMAFCRTDALVPRLAPLGSTRPSAPDPFAGRLASGRSPGKQRERALKRLALPSRGCWTNFPGLSQILYNLPLSRKHIQCCTHPPHTYTYYLGYTTIYSRARGAAPAGRGMRPPSVQVNGQDARGAVPLGTEHDRTGPPHRRAGRRQRLYRR